MRFMAIDPGTVKAGWAVFERTDTSPARLLGAGVVKPPKAPALESFTTQQRRPRSPLKVLSNLIARESSPKFVRANVWVERCELIASGLLIVAGMNDVEEVVIELCEHQGGSRGAKAEGSGSIIKLAYFIGYLTRLLLSQKIRVRLVRVRTWKGTTPKQLTAKRMKRRWGDLPSEKEDAIDAIGLGSWLLFKRK